MIERFAVPDQLTYYCDRPAEPANVHVQVLASGDLLAQVAQQTRPAKEHQGPQVDLASRTLRPLFAAEDATEFAARYAKAIDQLTESPAGRR
jgi:hypothetical protein